MIEKFSSKGISRRPDQTVDGLNRMVEQIEGMQSSLRILSPDKQNVIIIGNQPIDPNTKKPYPFGVRRYQVKGDRLIPNGELQWN